MNDLERRLRELGEQSRMRLTGELSPRPDALRTIRRRRFAAATSVFTSVAIVAAAGAFVWARNDTERPALPPAEARRTPDPSTCGWPLDFEPTYLPPGFREVAHRSDAPGVIARFDGNEGAVIDVTTPEWGFQQTRPTEIDVLHGPATIGAIHEGYSVAFDRARCRYVMNGYGVTKRELRLFAEGLRELTPLPFTGMWPEDSRAAAYDTCKSQPLDRRWPVLVAKDFVADVLGWHGYTLDTSDKGNPRKFDIHRPVSADNERVPHVQVFVREVLPGCWSVHSVTTGRDRLADDPVVTVRDGVVEISFDPHGAVAATAEVEYGGRVATATWSGGTPVVRLDLRFEPTTTGHFLIVLRDSNGAVVGAIGAALPPGDFVSG